MPRGIPGSGGGNYGITIAANVKGTQNIKRLGNSMQGVQGKAKNLAGSFKGLVKPLAAIALAVGTFRALKSSFQVLAEREADFATLANGLKRVSTDAPKAAKALRGIADELGFKTLFDEKAFQKGFALLTSFKNIGLDSYGRVAETAADLAQINQVDLKSSFLQLAKALSDPTRGLTALSRSGVIFTEQQREMILELHNAGREMEAQAAILKIVEGSYQGAARAAATGLAGAFDTLGQKFRDFNESLGGATAPFMEPLVRATSELFDVASLGLDGIADDMEVFAKDAVIALTPLFKFILENLKNIFTWLDEVFATQRNLAKIQVATGDEFGKERAKLRDESLQEALKRWQKQAVIKEGDFKRKAIFSLRDKDVFYEKGDPLIGTVRDIRLFQEDFNKLKNEIFQERVAAYVENELGLKAITPKIKEVTKNIEQQENTLKGLVKSSKDVKKTYMETFGDSMKEKIDEFVESMNDVGGQIGEVFVKAFKGMEDALVDFVMTGKLSFKDLANSIIRDMIRIAIQQSITKPLAGAFSNILGSIFKPTPSAKGNVFSGGNHLTAYAKGGVVNQPTLFSMGGSGNFGIMGEGSGPEAILPLKRRNGVLGVEGGGGTNVVVNVDASGTEVQGNENEGKMLGQLIAAAVQSTIIKEQRPGGLLAPA